MGYWPSLFGQDGWILAKFFFCVFMNRGEVEFHKHAKKERGQYPAILTEQAQNGCYGNQPHSFEVLFYSIGTNTSCSFTEQDSTFKQAYCVSLRFVLCKEPKSCQLTLCFSPFYRPDLEIAWFCNTCSGLNISCRVTDVKMLRFFFGLL